MPAKATNPSVANPNPAPELSPDQLNSLVGQLKGELQGELGPLLAQLQSGAGTQEQFQGLVDIISNQVNQTKEQAFQKEYPHYDHANHLAPQLFGGGKDGFKQLLKENASAREGFKPLSSGIAYAANHQKCYTGRAVNWVAETNVVGDVMYILAAIGIIGGVVFLGKMAYDAWIA
jgi:hypothetical protein